MKKLILIRHGEAEPETGQTIDFDRDLTLQGKKEAAKTAALLLNKITVPDYLISSTAVRAFNTAHIFAATFGLDEVTTEARIYEASAETLLKVVNRLNNMHQTVCLVGHNPGVSNLLYLLTGRISTMATSSWAEIVLNADTWAETSADSGQLINIQQP